MRAFYFVVPTLATEANIAAFTDLLGVRGHSLLFKQLRSSYREYVDANSVSALAQLRNSVDLVAKQLKFIGAEDLHLLAMVILTNNLSLYPEAKRYLPYPGGQWGFMPLGLVFSEDSIKTDEKEHALECGCFAHDPDSFIATGWVLPQACASKQYGRVLLDHDFEATNPFGTVTLRLFFEAVPQVSIWSVTIRDHGSVLVNAVEEAKDIMSDLSKAEMLLALCRNNG